MMRESCGHILPHTASPNRIEGFEFQRETGGRDQGQVPAPGQARRGSTGANFHRERKSRRNFSACPPNRCPARPMHCDCQSSRHRKQVFRSAVPNHKRWDSLHTRDAEGRSEEHTSELQSLMRISYAVFCLKKKKHTNTT